MVRRTLLLAFSFVAVFALIACGNDDDDDAEATPDNPAEETVDASPEATGSPSNEQATSESGDEAEETPEATPTPDSTSEPTATAEPTTSASPAATQRSGAPSGPAATPVPEDNTIVVACNDIYVPLDKQHRLPADCVPNDLLTLPDFAVMRGGQQMIGEAAHAFVSMSEAAALEGHEILARSTYRSYDTQVATYSSHVQSVGQAQADRVSARPGHSEHQLGTTVDLTTPQVGYELSQALGDTAAGQWLAENAWRYGFVMSYPAGKESITGYSYEPWHYRYVTPEIAAQVRDSGLTLREFLLR